MVECTLNEPALTNIAVLIRVPKASLSDFSSATPFCVHKWFGVQSVENVLFKFVTGPCSVEAINGGVNVTTNQRLLKEPVRVGDLAPVFTLPSQSGVVFNLADLIGKKSIVLYFYPKDFSRGCTAEACAFRDSYEAFKEVDAEVIGVSSQSVESHDKFASLYKLPFTLLSDENDQVRKLYGVPSMFGILPGRVTYVIDKKGIIRYIFNSQLNPTKHIEEALRIIREINAS